MFTLGFDELKKRIMEEKGLSSDEIDSKVKERMDKLSGLISKEGAIHIIANELGMKLLNLNKKRVKINQLSPGMRGIELSGKVVNFYGIKEFKTEKRSGKVASMLIGDETGKTRIVIWEEKLMPLIENIKQDDIIKVTSGYVRENNGYKEVHLGADSKVDINPEGEAIDFVASLGEFTRKKISELNESDKRISLIGTIVQIFEPKFYEVCPECGKRVRQDNGIFKCLEHNEVTPIFNPVITVFLDDGTDAIRVVCFRGQAEKILGIDSTIMQKVQEKTISFDELKKSILGSQMVINGKVTKNAMFNKLEFIASQIEMADPKVLVEQLLV